MKIPEIQQQSAMDMTGQDQIDPLLSQELDQPLRSPKGSIPLHARQRRDRVVEHQDPEIGRTAPENLSLKVMQLATRDSAFRRRHTMRGVESEDVDSLAALRHECRLSKVASHPEVGSKKPQVDRVQGNVVVTRDGEPGNREGL